MSSPLSHAALAEIFTALPRAKSARRIGVEWEQFAVIAKTGVPLPFVGPVSITTWFDILIAQHGWQAAPGVPILELQHAMGRITLEPGGAIEFSTIPVTALTDLQKLLADFDTLCRRTGTALGIEFIAQGFHPTARLADMPRINKPRYAVMRDLMPRAGTMGLDMMHRTASVQINIEAANPAEQAEMVWLATVLQPITSAYFANARIVEGRDSGYASYRQQAWLHTDPARTGLLSGALTPAFTLDDYVDTMLVMPLYFAVRDDQYLPTPNAIFADFRTGRLALLPGEYATTDDWVRHASTAFHTVRLKPWLELRAHDSLPWPEMWPLLKLWADLLWSDAARTALRSLCAEWTRAEIIALYQAIPKTGKTTMFRGQAIENWAEKLLAIAASD